MPQRTISPGFTGLAPGAAPSSMHRLHTAVTPPVDTRRLAREEGVFVGVSAAAAVAASLDLAERIRHGIIVTVLCDGGVRYLGDRFWTEGSEVTA